MTPPLYLLLDNLRSAYNVGSIFRSADAAGVAGLFLCGITPLPPHPKLAKTALGSLDSVPWTHHCSAEKCLAWIKASSLTPIVLETTTGATSIFTCHFTSPTVFILGNEVSGVDPALVSAAAKIVKIPQFGLKESLNVASAAAIAIYEFRRQQLSVS